MSDQLPKMSRSTVKAHEINADSLYTMWHQDLNPPQQSILSQAGILPFLKAVTYRSDTALCAALIDFMVDGELIVGQSKLEITEEEIQQATGLPISGKHVSPSTDYDRVEITVKLTKFKIGANNSGLLLDFIIDPLVRFAAKFLAYRLLGLKKPGYIPFKFVQTAIEVSQGVCFNWCKFVKERMLQQIEFVQRERKGTFNYSTILQFLAFKAFNDSWIPHAIIGEGEPFINVYNICGRDVAKSKEEKRMVNRGISCIIDNIMKEHGHRVILSLTAQVMDAQEMQTREKKNTMNNAYVWYTDKKAKLEVSANVDEMPSATATATPAADGIIGCISFDNSKLCSGPENGEAPKSSSGETELCLLSREQPQPQRQNKDYKGLERLEIENSRLLSEKDSLEEEKSLWEVERAALEAQKMQLSGEKMWALQEKQQLEMENSRLQAHLIQEIQITAELQRKLNKIKESWGQFSSVMNMEFGDL